MRADATNEIAFEIFQCYQVFKIIKSVGRNQMCLNITEVHQVQGSNKEA
jgi:hypothetical protein